ncbi:hypothetical protein A0128_16695 [Leptospira tipperaryensis]|uniref:Uncharacterized protein n=1 Tax=Leptospira tipperaryensis TaxID=2564040 RepID=A0A1D7V0H7_9LEPT|nr:hypothetical protein A0128_16695 [Leptospira tipperaryensis]
MGRAIFTEGLSYLRRDFSGILVCCIEFGFLLELAFIRRQAIFLRNPLSDQISRSQKKIYRIKTDLSRNRGSQSSSFGKLNLF